MRSLRHSVAAALAAGVLLLAALPAAAQNGTRTEERFYGFKKDGDVNFARPPRSAAPVPEPETRGSASSTAPSYIAPAPAFVVPMWAEIEPLSLHTVRFTARRDAAMGHIDCPGEGGTLTLAGGSLNDSEAFTALFYEGIRSVGYSVAGDPNALFPDAAGRRFLVGAQVWNLSLNAQCYRTERSYEPDNLKGEATISVLWQVYDNVARRVVHQRQVVGRADLAQHQEDGMLILLLGAFADAVDRFARDQTLLDLLIRENRGAVQGSLAPPPAAGPITVAGPAPSREPASRRMARVQDNTVTILFADGHGSGFFVDRETVLTNHHVAGTSRTARLRLFDGREISGQVLRSDVARDVAEILVPRQNGLGLPVRTDPVAVGEDVYAVGAPVAAALAGTVSRGIVSAVRRVSGKPTFIQSDVTIHGGNSGGPLLDTHGNVVGIAVAGLFMGEDRRGSGLNLFIPIVDAFRSLDLRLAGRDWP